MPSRPSCWREGAHVVVASLDPARNAQGGREAEGQDQRPRDRRADRSQRRGARSRPVQTHARRVRPARHPGQQRHQRLAGQLLRDGRGEPGTTPSTTSCAAPCAASATPCRRCASANGAASSTSPAAPPGRRSSAPSPPASTTPRCRISPSRWPTSSARTASWSTPSCRPRFAPTATTRTSATRWQKTGQSEDEVLKPRVAKIPLGPHGRGRGDRQRGRIPVVGARELRHRQRLGGRWRRIGAAVNRDDGPERTTGNCAEANFDSHLAAMLLRGAGACAPRSRGRRLSDPSDHAYRSARTGRPERRDRARAGQMLVNVLRQPLLIENRPGAGRQHRGRAGRPAPRPTATRC